MTHARYVRRGWGRFCSQRCNAYWRNATVIASRKDEDEFFRRVDRSQGDDGCWNWTRSLSQYGYARWNRKGHQVQAHRWAYEHFVGPIPEGLQLDHLCRNTKCVNPRHLEPVTNRENSLRGISPAAQNAKKTHCHQGHPFAGDNLYISPKGKRGCRICNAAKQAKLREARRLALLSVESQNW
jgi:hypothetical protein